IGLGAGGSPADAADLAGAMADEPLEDVRVALAWALGRVGDADHVPALVRMLEASGGSAAVVTADALGEIGTDAAVEALIGALFEPDAAVRRAAAAALRRASVGRS